MTKHAEWPSPTNPPTASSGRRSAINSAESTLKLPDDQWAWRHIHDQEGLGNSCSQCGWDWKTYPWWCISGTQMEGVLMMMLPVVLSGSLLCLALSFCILYIVALAIRHSTET